MALELDDQRRDALVRGLQGLYLSDFEEELSTFRAEQVLDYFLATLGPQVYNQAVQDARVFMQRKLEDLDGEVYLPEQV